MCRPLLVCADTGSEEQEEESSEPEIETVTIDQIEIIDNINNNTDEKVNDVNKSISDISEKVEENQEINKENNQMLKDMRTETEEEQTIDYTEQFTMLHEDIQKIMISIWALSGFFFGLRILKDIFGYG